MLVVQNIDVRGVPYLEKGRSIYIRESDLNHVAEMNGFDNISAIFEYISETYSSPMHEFKLVRDKNIPGILAESYVPDMFDDSILNEFEMYDIVSEAVTMSDEKMWVFLSKSLAKFKKGDYEEAPTIEYRLKACQREINNVKEEIKDVKTYDSKSIKQIRLIKFLIKSISRLGVKSLATSILGLFGLKPVRNIWKEINDKVKSVQTVMSIVNYEGSLSRYLYELEKVEDYLKEEIKNAKKRDQDRSSSKKVVKESSINDKCIADINI